MKTLKTLTILNERPKSWNEFYSGKHWSVRNAEAKRVHALVRSMLSPDDRPFDHPVAIRFTVYYDSKPQDSCNMTAKLYTDGLLATGDWQDGFRSWLWDDDMRYVVSTTTVPRVDEDHPRVVIEILEVSHGIQEQDAG